MGAEVEVPTDLIPSGQWIEIVAAIGYDESADPEIFRAIERGAALAVAADLERVADCVRLPASLGGSGVPSPRQRHAQAALDHLRGELRARASELRGEV